jgi:hypothetical protein
MSHTYLRFDFGTDEGKAQQARHKLDDWKQAFRLDKKLLYKLDRAEAAAAEAGEATKKPAKAGKLAASEKSKAKGKSKSAEAVDEESAPRANGKLSLLVRLYFSSHEKLSEQRWVARIPVEEPFKGASPKVIGQEDPDFEKTDQQFESLE